ncbi:MAG: hypothetical protein AAB263_02455 [Planctomycetota bacterium]
MNCLIGLLLASLCVIPSGCSSQRPVSEAELHVIRTYGWASSVLDPAPEWNPKNFQLVARTLTGFSLLEEGGRGERTYASEGRHAICFPRWINEYEFVFGPATNATRSTDGHVIHPSDGLTVVDLSSNKPIRRRLSDRGFQPKPTGLGEVCAQDEQHIIMIDDRGRSRMFSAGFDPEPQFGGAGLCWRDTPAFSPDWWTGKTGIGMLNVRWSPGHVDQVAGGIQAAWTWRGELLVTAVKDTFPAGKPWWSAGTTLLLLTGPGSEPKLLRTNVRDPAPHPQADLLAWVDDLGALWIGTQRPDGWSERISTNGERPRWSHDGLRLCWLEPTSTDRRTPLIQVAVLGKRR